MTRTTKTPRIDIGSIRREQIVEAAAAVIAERGIQHLSLSEIEKKAGMSRGQLTYYFPAKEDILLAVFDRLVQRLYERVGTPQGLPPEQAGGWEWVRHLLQTVPEQPRASPEFHCLQYTFLSQIGHRADFRARLARLYEEWRGNVTRGLADDLALRPPVRPVSPRALATLVQALLHGLAVQAAADPRAFDHGEMVHLCLDLLGSYLWATPEANGRKQPANGRKSPRQRKARR